MVTMVVGGAGILANCLNIFVLSRYRGNYLYRVHFIRQEVNISIHGIMGRRFPDNFLFF